MPHLLCHLRRPFRCPSLHNSIPRLAHKCHTYHHNNNSNRFHHHPHCSNIKCSNTSHNRHRCYYSNRRIAMRLLRLAIVDRSCADFSIRRPLRLRLVVIRRRPAVWPLTVFDCSAYSVVVTLAKSFCHNIRIPVSKRMTHFLWEFKIEQISRQI